MYIITTQTPIVAIATIITTMTTTMSDHIIIPATTMIIHTIHILNTMHK